MVVFSRLFNQSGRTLGVERVSSFLRDQQVGQCKQGVQLCGFFGQTFVPHFFQTKDIFDVVKRKLHTGPDRGLQPHQYAGDLVPACFAQGFAFAGPHGHMAFGLVISWVRFSMPW